MTRVRHDAMGVASWRAGLRISPYVPHVEATFRRANNIQHVPTFRPCGYHICGTIFRGPLGVAADERAERDVER